MAMKRNIKWEQGGSYTLSNAAFLEKAAQKLDALKPGGGPAVLVAGGQLESFARVLLPGLDPRAFIQAGDLTKAVLGLAARRKIKCCLLAGQMGRVAKLALQDLDPLIQGGSVDLLKLAAYARAAGASESRGLSIAAAGTARRAFECALGQAWSLKFFKRLCQRAARNAWTQSKGKLKVEVWLVDYEGKLLAKGACGK